MQDVTDVTTQQSQALELLMAGQPHGNVAHILGIHRQTLWRWRRLPAFAALQAQQHQWNQQRREEMNEQIHELFRLSAACITRELKLGENEAMRNPLATALAVLKTINRSNER